MKWGKWLEKWDMTSLKIKMPFLEMEWNPQDEDKAAAWDLYIELLTRVATQRLAPAQGTEKAALASIYQLFPLTREIIKRNGRSCANFTKIAVVVLNQVVRPFTTKWHSAFEGREDVLEDEKTNFRDDLLRVQAKLKNYMKLLADMAGVEDITELETT